MKFYLFALFIASVSAHGPHEPPGFFDYTNCCQIEKSAATTQFIDSMSKLAEECKAELGEPETEGPPIFGCLHQCLGNKTNITNADQSLNEDGYRSFITTQMATEDYLKTAADGIATDCIEKVKPADNSGEGPDGCSQIAMKALNCAALELTNACPSDQQDTDEHCIRFREFINGGFQGKGAPPSPPHPGM